ncbi:MAG: permease, partial [Myxococcota bacterium]|nr:permease [Myxococcota bacterium]
FALVELVPDSLEHGGVWALLAIVAGLLVPTLVERRSAGAHEHGSSAALVVLVVAGLAIHAFMDGSALALQGVDHGAGHGEYLALAVLIHRLPLGFVIAWLAPASWPMARIVGLASAIAVMTAVGYVLGQQIVPTLDAFGIALFQGAMAGTLLHVVLVHPPHSQDLGQRPARLAALVGFLVGLGVVGGVLGTASHGPGHDAHVLGAGMIETFVLLAGESAPALLAAFLGAGLLRVFMSEGLLQWLGRGRVASQAFRGMIFGLPLPICSCGVVPLYEGLIRAGTPAAAALAFLVATPEIGLGAVLISLPLLGMEMTILRVLCAVVAAWVVATVTVRFVTPTKPDVADIGIDLGTEQSVGQRLVAGLRYGLRDLVEDIMPWI